MNVLILDNYDSFTHNLFHYLKAYTPEVTVKRNDEITLPEIDAFSHVVLSPGPGLPKDAGILIPLLENYMQRKPIMGICLGMQAIAESLGGKLYNQDKVKHGIQEEVNLLKTEEGIFKGLNPQEQVGLYHSWAVEKQGLPDSMEIIAEGKTGVIMGLQHNELPVYGVQFHPESVMTPKGKQMIKNWLEATKA